MMRAKAKRARVTRTNFREHPWLTWGAVGSGVVAVIAVAGTVVPWIVAAVQNLETKSDVDAKILLARAYADDNKAEVLNALVSSQKNNVRNMAWMSATGARVEMLLTQIPVDACDVKLEAKQPMTMIERQACGRYRFDYGQAKARYERAQSDAMIASK